MQVRLLRLWGSWPSWLVDSQRRSCRGWRGGAQAVAVADDAGLFTVCTQPVAAAACATWAVNDACVDENGRVLQGRGCPCWSGAYVFGLAHPAASSQKRLSTRPWHCYNTPATSMDPSAAEFADTLEAAASSRRVRNAPSSSSSSSLGRGLD